MWFSHRRRSRKLWNLRISWTSGSPFYTPTSGVNSKHKDKILTDLTFFTQIQHP